MKKVKIKIYETIIYNFDENGTPFEAERFTDVEAPDKRNLKAIYKGEFVRFLEHDETYLVDPMWIVSNCEKVEA